MTENPKDRDIAAFQEPSREQQQRVRELEMLQFITESAAEGILVAISREGAIQFVNDRASTMFGYTHEELQGAQVELLIPERLRHRHIGHRADYFHLPRSRSMGIGFDLKGRKKDGTEFPVEVSLAYRQKENQEMVLAIITDISDRERLELAKRQKEKLECLGVMAGGLAHDFNNLLTGIIGNASLIAEELPRDSSLRQHVKAILRAGQHAADLTRKLLAYTGKGLFQITSLDVHTLVQEMMSLLRSSIPTTIRIQLEVPEELPPIAGDSGPLTQLLISLVTNAVEAIGSTPGTIWIRAGAADTNEPNQGAVSATDVPLGRCVRIEVKDTGCGMDGATMTRIYDPFFTTKFTGRGLGLAAARGIVEAHHGVIRVDSEPGRGSSFTVFLPLASSAAAAGPGADPSMDLSGSGTVLMVDDEEAVRYTAKAALTHYGYTVLLAEDGPSAIGIMRASGNRIRAVVLDLSMPGMNGMETLSHLRQLNPGVPILLSSGYDVAEASRQFAGHDLSGFIQKPCTGARLARHLKQVLEPSVDRPSDADRK